MRREDFTIATVPARYAALGVLAVAFACLGLGMGLNAPPDYQQGATVLIMFVHVPAAWLGMFAYGCLATCAFFGLVRSCGRPARARTS